MLIVTGLVEFHPDDVDAFMEIGKDMIAASRAEPECHGYAYYRDINNPNLFRAYEQWTNEKALQNHFRQPHTKTFEARLQKLRITSFEVIKYDRGHVRSLR